MISMYRNSTDIIGMEVDHYNVLKAIAEGRWQADIQNLRLLIKETDRYAESKRALPSVTFAGTFSKRGMENMVSYTHMMVIDIDKLNEVQVNHYKKEFQNDQYIHACFVSPSGLGLKILIPISTRPEHHIHAFLALEDYFKNTYAVDIDKSGKDVSRLCYISWDPELYLNDDAVHFAVNVEEMAIKVQASGDHFDERPDRFKGHVISKDAKYAFKICEKWTQRNHQYGEGNRNNYIHVLSCNMNRAGVHHDDALLLIYNTYSDYPYKEMQTTVNSAYRRTSEHNIVDVYNTEEANLPDHTDGLNLTLEEETIFNDTLLLLDKGVPKNVIAKLIKNFGIGYFSMEETHVGKVMNMAVESQKNDVSKNSLDIKSVDQLLIEAVKAFKNTGGISTLVAEIDDAMNGGLMPGSYYGFVGTEGSFKSIIVQLIASNAAKKGILSIYLNGEMGSLQLIDRLANSELKINIRQGLRNETISEKDVLDISEKLKQALHNNFYIVSQKDWTQASILATVKSIEIETGKKVGLIVVDGLTQMEDTKKDEIKSAIFNSGELKQVAKLSDAAVVALIHTSGGIHKHLRNTSNHARGGAKVTANMDAVFCTSMLIDESASDFDNGDILYIGNKFYLRLKDKREASTVLSKIVQVNRPMELVPLEIDPGSVEVKIS